MSRQLLAEANSVVALPCISIALQGQTSEGLLWDLGQEEVVIESLHAFTKPPDQSDIQLDMGALASAVMDLGNHTEGIGSTAIFGGYLFRHFGHFMHESLSRLWWLGKGTCINPLVNQTKSRLQAEAGDVVFFMPPSWGEVGKGLPTYMVEVLTGLGLPIERIRILEKPTHLRHLLIPAQCWGLFIDEPAWNKHLGFDCRQLMRTLLTSYTPTPAPADDGLPPAGKLYVTRSGLPLKFGRLLGDVILDRLMEAASFQIFHPERHTVAEQIRQYSQARELVFMDGSALYLLWLCRLRPGVRISVILRRRGGRWMCGHVKRLMPPTAGLRWRLLNTLTAESLTSQKEWESHNLANLAALVPRLAPKTCLPRDQILTAAATCTEELMAHTSAEQLGRVLTELLTLVAYPVDQPPRGLKARLRRLAGRVKRRLTSP